MRWEGMLLPIDEYAEPAGSVVPVGRGFYMREPEEVARALLGLLLLRRTGPTLVGGVIVETEAYLGPDDPGSHAARGRMEQNAAMWAVGGTAYVYQIYGVHYCLNIVTGPEGVPRAVLIRAVMPTIGIDYMRARRRRHSPQELCSGPAKLCQAMDIDLRLNFADLVSDQRLFIASPADPSAHKTRRVITTTRIGLPKGRGDTLPLRFYVADEPYVKFVSRRDRRAEAG